ncbi:hypothetical protein KFK09_003587 [Dendrobium nobile]|uniref:Uncharacterized protein n=1 Tax=Dendrobium nobile TaxID=94219 RepID=A0A8T3C0K2_DENNO|nr:hypothetical protein KFK09_003587 [Dendrobium nobile]
MSSGGISSSASAPSAVQAKERSKNPGPQQPARLTMPWNRPRPTSAGDGESLPEWKLNCLCADQTILSPTMRGGLAWF